MPCWIKKLLTYLLNSQTCDVIVIVQRSRTILTFVGTHKNETRYAVQLKTFSSMSVACARPVVVTSSGERTHARKQKHQSVICSRRVFGKIWKFVITVAIWNIKNGRYCKRIARPLLQSMAVVNGCKEYISYRRSWSPSTHHRHCRVA